MFRIFHFYSSLCFRISFAVARLSRTHHQQTHCFLRIFLWMPVDSVIKEIDDIRCMLGPGSRQTDTLVVAEMRFKLAVQLKSRSFLNKLVLV